MASTVPTWQAATVNSQGNAGHVNQFLGTHKASVLYSGVVQASQTTGNGVFNSSQNTWLSQTFTTTSTQTTVGSVSLQINAVGGSPTLVLIPPITIGIYATTAGSHLPTGAALTSTMVNSNYIYTSSFFVFIPLPVTGLSVSTTYAIVTQPVGTATNYYAWQHSNQTSGAATSPDGVTWTAQSFGFMYKVSDLSVVGNNIQAFFEDSGARTMQFTYNSSGMVTGIIESTNGQTSTTYLRSSRTLSYSNGLLTGAA